MASIETRKGVNGNSYRVLIRVKGYAPVSNTFTSLKAAKHWASVNEGAMRDGRFVSGNESLRKTLSDAIQRYIEVEVPRRRTDSKKVLTQLEWWHKRLGHYLLKDVTTARIRECQEALERTVTRRGTRMAPATVLRYMVCLSHVFSVASKQWEWVSDNPVQRVKKPKPDNERDRVLNGNETALLLTACRASSCRYLYPVVFLALATAARRSEIMGLKWEDIDWKSPQLKFEKTKNGQKRSVSLTHDAVVVLKELNRVRQLNSPYLFPRLDGVKPLCLQKHWLAALQEADISDFRFHDLRHTTATNLAKAGASALQLREILGHQTLQMVTRYAHLTPNHNAAILERAVTNMLAEAS